MARVVLVTGVSRYLGGRLAGVLRPSPASSASSASTSSRRAHDIGGADFVRADIRNPVIAKVIARAEVDTVVHMSVIATPAQARRPGLDEGDQRHRHDAAARGLPEGADACAGSS